MSVSRRQFLSLSALAGLSSVLPGSLRAADSLKLVNPARYLVLVQLSGGNDSLNALCPYNNADYIAARTFLRLRNDPTFDVERRCSQLPAQGANPVTGWGMHAALAPLLGAWNAGDLAWIRGVGYANPNRSHFRGIEIFDTGSTDDDVSVPFNTGWAGRALAAEGMAVDVDGGAAVFGGTDETPLFHPDVGLLGLSSAAEFVDRANGVSEPTPTQLATTNPALKHLLVTRQLAVRARTRFEAAATKSEALATAFADDYFSRQCQEATACIAAGIKTPIFKLELGGFDTHSDQKGNHADLLSDLANGLSAMRTELSRPEVNKWNDVLIMTYSEFGRRFQENDSEGTDHGTVASHLFMGGSVNGGLHGTQPSMADADLEDRDMVATCDFRRLAVTACRHLGVTTPNIQTAMNPWPGVTPRTWDPLGVIP